MTSSSELTSPLVEFASIRSRVPGRTPRRTSPETDWTLICPSRIASMRWSPETVFTDRSVCASSIAKSPETSVAETGPVTVPRRTSPETV